MNHLLPTMAVCACSQLLKCSMLLWGFPPLVDMPGFLQWMPGLAYNYCVSRCWLSLSVCLSCMSLGNYVNPKLSTQKPVSATADNAVDPHDLNLRQYTQIFAKLCVYCRSFHSDKTYCFQNSRMSARECHRSSSPSYSLV